MEWFGSALDVAAAISSRQVSPTEVMEHYLGRVDALDDRLNAFALRDDDRALADAHAATDLVTRADPADLPPFTGVPIPIKDLNDVAGWPTTHGSFAVSDEPAERDEDVVRRFRDAGFVLMGKTTTPEFGSISFTESKRLGITRNPWDTEHTPGGSSGGAGAAVASAMAPVAHASDGGGSIRIPASCCGLVGLKPSRNRVTNGVEIFGGGATSGVVSRTVADTAAILDVLAEFDLGAFNVAPPPSQPFAREVGSSPGVLRIRVETTNPVGIPVDPACVTAVERAASLLEGLGHRVDVEPVQWPDPYEFLADFALQWSTGTAYVPLTDPELLEPHDLADLRAAESTSALEYANAQRRLQVGSRSFVRQFGGSEAGDFDVLVTPTMAVEPPKVGACWTGADENPAAVLGNCFPMAVYTAMFNLTGLPAMSLPLHMSESGLPVGVQFVAPPWSEAVLLRLGSQIESAAPWTDRWPALTEAT